MKNISILGSTGSIGTQSLDIVRKSPDIKVLGLSAHKNVKLLEAQAREFLPESVCMTDEESAKDLAVRLADTNVKVLSGTEGLSEIAALKGISTVITAVMGIVGLKPTMRAIEEKKTIALANKETLVSAGQIVMAAAKKNSVSILPVDSEHSAIFQALEGMHKKEQLEKLILTASGGPFLGKDRTFLKTVTKQMALKHPNWSMGAKITIDSSTLVNKGLEVIEASRLFDMPSEKIDVVIQPQSIIHSMIEYIDGSVIAQLGQPDMHLPIAYALTYPDRMDIGSVPLDFAKIANISFFAPDNETFPAISLARKALIAGGTMTAVFNGADEAAVSAFLQDKIRYCDITDVIENAMSSYTNTADASIENVLEADKWARQFVYSKFNLKE